MNTLYATVGLPRSGKSTWAVDSGLPVVSPDAIRLALTGQPFVPVAEPMVWGVAQTMVRSLFLAGNDSVILDSTNVTMRRRSVWYGNDLWTTVFVPFETPVEECLSRLTDDNQYLIEVIHRMDEEFERVQPMEGLVHTPNQTCPDPQQGV